MKGIILCLLFIPQTSRHHTGSTVTSWPRFHSSGLRLPPQTARGRRPLTHGRCRRQCSLTSPRRRCSRASWGNSWLRRMSGACRTSSRGLTARARGFLARRRPSSAVSSSLASHLPLQTVQHFLSTGFYGFSLLCFLPAVQLCAHLNMFVSTCDLSPREIDTYMSN